MVDPMMVLLVQCPDGQQQGFPADAVLALHECGALVIQAPAKADGTPGPGMAVFAPGRWISAQPAMVQAAAPLAEVAAGMVAEMVAEAAGDG